MKRWLWLVILLLGCGGADNAILELGVRLPASPTGDPVYALITMRSSATSTFDVAWEPGELDGFLLEASPRTEVISVVAQANDVGSDLLVRATFCSTPRCDGFGDDMAGERRLVVEEPFYAGKFTSAEWELLAVETAVVETPDRVERCSVGSDDCRPGVTVSYCRMDGSHFCEGE